MIQYIAISKGREVRRVHFKIIIFDLKTADTCLLLISWISIPTDNASVNKPSMEASKQGFYAFSTQVWGIIGKS